ncbi:hypothetical protein GCG54_00014977 [Colletotrichum gloeosporioides]|uniref:Kelch repeat protein n=1 Tax=Colletotrichum gloeosporioides TaxID=474922 RepID=A0A8H4CDH6_COLGL|nr:uncharacterized protein GCG54_00014977 [Colletotrichum gloeosporioides]KAF3801759.1 hypothetical protein GCG54_00014977 [Colletotrichum gloeosporioides]
MPRRSTIKIRSGNTTRIQLSLGEALFPKPRSLQLSCGNLPLMEMAAGFGVLRISTPKNCPAFVDLTVGHLPANQIRAFNYFGGFEETKTKIDPKMPVGGLSSAQLHNTRGATSVDEPNGYTLLLIWYPLRGNCPLHSQGLIMILAGAEYNSTNQEPGNLSMEVVWFVDPVTKRWYSQKTIGQAPEPRRWACVVGAQSLNNTYDIFLFGGLTDNRVGFGDVWILSLPGFVWIQADAKQMPRAYMSCVVAGRRQMITVGGVDPSLPQGTPMEDPDTFHQGIGVLDLTSLEWTDEYNSLAAAYESLNAVKSWYNEGNLASVRYDTGVEDLMSSSFSLELPGLGDGTGGDSNSTILGNHQDNSLHPAAMGGIVGGSILAAAVAGIVILLLARRRKRRRQSIKQPATEPDCPELATARAKAS